VPERTFTVAEAQALLDEVVRPLAERMVELCDAMAPLQREWQTIVIKIGSNGGGLDHERARALREGLEKGQAELTELVEEVVGLGVQVKDPTQGLIDFPTTIDGEPALLCWRAGEGNIEYWHTLEGGFAGRRPLP
jgi:hypothetical protein